MILILSHGILWNIPSRACFSKDVYVENEICLFPELMTQLGPTFTLGTIETCMHQAYVRWRYPQDSLDNRRL